MLDRSADKAVSSNFGTESLTTIGIASLAASGQAEAIRKLFSQVVGDMSDLVQIVLWSWVIFWSAAIVASKRESNGARVSRSDGGVAPRRKTYSYSQFLRNLAKLAFVLFVAMLPFRVMSIAAELTPLQTTIYGAIYKDGDRPVESTAIHLMSSDGEDLTSGDWFTDSRGFFIARAKRRLRRSDLIKTAIDGCKTEQMLPLAKSNEATLPIAELHLDEAASRAYHFFVYHVDCEGK